MNLKRASALFALVLLALEGIAATPAAALTETDRRIYADAFAAAKRGDWSAGERTAKAARDRLLAQVLPWLQYIHGGAGASFADIAAFIDAHPDWPDQELLRQAAEAAIATATDAQLAPWFAKHPPVLPAARLRLAQIWMDSGRQADAIRLIRQTWIEGDYTAVEEKLMLQRYHGILRGEDNARRLDRLIWDGDIEQAKHMVRHVGPETAALAEARIGLMTTSPGVEGLIARVPERLRNDSGLLFDRLLWRRHKDLDDDAATILEHPPADLERPEAWAAERLIIARRILDEGQPQRAYRLAANTGLDQGPLFAELEFLAGWIALRELHQPEAAYNHFVRLYQAVKLPVSLARGAYWSACAAEAMRQPSLAATWYAKAAPFITTYYGQLAAAHIGGVNLAAAFREPSPTQAETEAFDRNELVRIARDLAQIGDNDDLAPFLRRISRAAKTPDEFALAARLARALDRPDIAVVTAKHASYAGVTLLDEGYPIPDLPRGDKTEVPLVLAMMRQESAFDHGAISNAGALGLMQVMPATANKIARLLHLPFSRRRLTTDVAYNMRIGRAYLDSLISDFSGSYVLAIAAYNAGPARVHQWIEAYGDPRRAGVDPVDWIERIPYAETRNYVQRVLESLQIYRIRIGAPLPSLSLASDLKR